MQCEEEAGQSGVMENSQLPLERHVTTIVTQS